MQTEGNQLDRDDLKGMTPEQIEAADRDGRFRDLLAGKATENFTGQE